MWCECEKYVTISRYDFVGGCYSLHLTEVTYLSDTTLAADIHAYEYCATLEVRNTSAAKSAHGGRPQ